MRKLGGSLDMRVHHVSGEHGAYILRARRPSLDISHPAMLNLRFVSTGDVILKFLNLRCFSFGIVTRRISEGDGHPTTSRVILSGSGSGESKSGFDNRFPVLVVLWALKSLLANNHEPFRMKHWRLSTYRLISNCFLN